MTNVGIVSMGAMGLTIAKSIVHSGNTVHWTSEGRSQTTIDNGRSVDNAIEHFTARGLLDSCEVLFCIGRLGAGRETILLAAENNFKGIYVDGNNLSGAESEEEIARIADNANINYIEALFRGFPLGYDQGGGEDKRDLYLSGGWRFSKVVESLFTDGIWKVHLVAESAKSLNRTKFNRLF